MYVRTYISSLTKVCLLHIDVDTAVSPRNGNALHMANVFQACSCHQRTMSCIPSPEGIYYIPMPPMVDSYGYNIIGFSGFSYGNQQPEIFFEIPDVSAPYPLMKAAASCRNVWYFKENLRLVISAREP